MFFVGAALDIFQALIGDLDTEGRYLFLNAVANQLRYPNTHTHYFSFILLYLFAESNQVWNVLFSISLECIVLCVFNFATDAEDGGLCLQPVPWAVGKIVWFLDLSNVATTLIDPVTCKLVHALQQNGWADILLLLSISTPNTPLFRPKIWFENYEFFLIVIKIFIYTLSWWGYSTVRSWPFQILKKRNL